MKPYENTSSIDDDAQLEILLSEPSEAAIRAMSQIEGDIILLGAAGKMGPSLTRMLKRASETAGIDRKIIAVSRFSDAKLLHELEANCIQTIRGDLLDETFLNELPLTPNVIFMTGMKFGTAQGSYMTWAMNTLLPANVCQRFRDSRILAFSTGNVYPFVSPYSKWSREEDQLDPVGEYGMSALGRERIFEYFSDKYQISTSIVRLNYAVELRYGVLLDLALQVFREQTIELSMGFANIIWQGDANAMAIAALADTNTPPFVVNVAGQDLLNVQETCETFGQLFGKSPRFTGRAADTALLNDGSRGRAKYGESRVSTEQLISWTADWVQRGGTTWNKPTHFQTRDGRF